MRFVKKKKTPQFFINDTSGLIEWDDYAKTPQLVKKKRKLREYILTKEQYGLCIYCESKISTKVSHLEHLKPKSIDVANLTFEYTNIVVSCDGTCHNALSDNTRYHCGHRKDRSDSVFVESKFLNPVVLVDISDYFHYDLDDFKIKSSKKDDIKADYMIDTLLHLNDSSLPLAREISLNNFIEKMKKITDIDERKKIMKKILNEKHIAFISFLRYKYRQLLV
jgi:uncharacterized protein (TIGR02646 family)